MRLTLTLVAVLVPRLLLAAEVPPLQTADLGDLRLESGEILRNATLGYRTAGRLNADRSNAILFPTWFTGSTEQLFATDSVAPVDTSRFFLVAVDAFANGVSSSPSNSARQPGAMFPRVTIGDMVAAQHRLLTEVLGISHLHAVMGISMGGMQTFEWVAAYPDFVDRAVPIVGSPRLASYDLLLWNAQLAVLDPAIACACNESRALKAVGMISLLALQTPQYAARQFPRDAAATLLSQGRSDGLAMDIHDRAAQLRAMIAHDVTRHHGDSLDAAAAAVRADMLIVVGLRDHMVTPGPALDFAQLVSAEVLGLANDCGHLATRCDADRANGEIGAFLAAPSR